MNLDAIVRKGLQGEGASVDEALFLAENVPLTPLLYGAGEIRERFFGKVIKLCAIVNARSGACPEDCRFCAQSAHYETAAPSHPLLESGKLVRAAGRARNSGAVSFGIVTSGPSLGTPELETVARAVNAVCSESGLETCASLGRLNEKELRMLKAGGLKRYHHNLETSRAFFPSVCSTHEWSERVETIKAAKGAGLRICSGGLFGMGETWEDRVSMAAVLRELEADSVPINFLHPVRGTPLEDRPTVAAEEGLRIIAVCRFMLPAATIRVCGGRAETLGVRQGDMFRAGANALMTGDYLTTTGVDPAEDCAMIEGLGFALAGGAQHARPPVA